MGFTRQLKDKHKNLWERMVTHPFVQELVDGTLPPEKFRRYFLQDYLFLKDLSIVLSLAISKAPDFDAARRLTSFLGIIVAGEEELFQRTFREMGMSDVELRSIERSPTCRAFGDFLVRVSHEGGFYDILTALAVVEGTYLDWAQRAKAAGKQPPVAAYREWIDIHVDQCLADFVTWMRRTLDDALLAGMEDHLSDIFKTCLLYEISFWEMAYKGEEWPK